MSLVSRDAVILDSNLLLLFLVGAWNPRAIATQKRLSGLTFADFLLLTDFLSSYRRILTTAHVLTEVSNLAGAASGSARTAIFTQLALVIGTLEEQHLSAVTLANQPEFLPFGLADAALSQLCVGTLLVTQDGRLAHHLQLKGRQAITLEQVRAMRNHTNRL